MKTIPFKSFFLAATVASVFASCGNPGDQSEKSGSETDSLITSSELPDEQDQLGSNAFAFLAGQEAYSNFNRLAALSPNVKRILELKNPIIVLVPSDALISTADESLQARFAGKEEAQTAEEMLLPYIFMIVEQNGKEYSIENFSGSNKFKLSLETMMLDNNKLSDKFVKVQNGIILESPIIIDDNLDF